MELKFKDDFSEILGYELPDEAYADILKSASKPHFNGCSRN